MCQLAPKPVTRFACRRNCGSVHLISWLTEIGTVHKCLGYSIPGAPTVDPADSDPTIGGTQACSLCESPFGPSPSTARAGALDELGDCCGRRHSGTRCRLPSIYCGGILEPGQSRSLARVLFQHTYTLAIPRHQPPSALRGMQTQFGHVLASCDDVIYPRVWLLADGCDTSDPDGKYVRACVPVRACMHAKKQVGTYCC